MDQSQRLGNAARLNNLETANKALTEENKKLKETIETLGKTIVELENSIVELAQKDKKAKKQAIKDIKEEGEYNGKDSYARYDKRSDY